MGKYVQMTNGERSYGHDGRSTRKVNALTLEVQLPSTLHIWRKRRLPLKQNVRSLYPDLTNKLRVVGWTIRRLFKAPTTYQRHDQIRRAGASIALVASRHD